MSISAGSFALEGIGLSSIVGVLLNFVAASRQKLLVLTLSTTQIYLKHCSVNGFSSVTEFPERKIVHRKNNRASGGELL